jgi:hypothetical protein
MTLVQLDDYLVAAHVIKDLFQFSPQAFAPTLASYAPSNVMLHLPAKANKVSEANKGIVKLMLFHIRGNIDMEATLVSNITPAIPSKGMQVKTSLVSDQIRFQFGSCQRSLHPICSKGILQPRRLPVSNLRPIQWNRPLFFHRGIKSLSNEKS